MGNSNIFTMQKYNLRIKSSKRNPKKKKKSPSRNNNSIIIFQVSAQAKI